MKPGAKERSKGMGLVPGLVVVLLVAGLWLTCFRFPVVWRTTGIGETGEPFLDLYGVLAAGEVAHSHGDPYRPLALDPLHRPHLYSAWWLVSGDVGLTRADAGWLGVVFAGSSLVAAVALLRPRNAREAGQAILVLCSPAMLMAINRGNNDLVVLVLISAALVCLRSASDGPRLLGVLLLAVSAVLKYYPLATLAVLLTARTRREWAIATGLFAAVVMLGWPAMKPGLASVAKYKPHPDGLYAFGAPTVFRDFGVQSAGWWLAGAVAIGIWVVFLLRQRWRADLELRPDVPAEREFFCGAVLMVGGFFLGASYLYKMIFAIWLLPWFWRTAPAGAADPWRRACWWLLVSVLWLEGVMGWLINVVIEPHSLPAAFGALNVTFVVSQLLTWALMVCLVRQLVFYCVRRARCLLAAPAPVPGPA